MASLKERIERARQQAKAGTLEVTPSASGDPLGTAKVQQCPAGSRFNPTTGRCEKIQAEQRVGGEQLEEQISIRGQAPTQQEAAKNLLERFTTATLEERNVEDVKQAQEIARKEGDLQTALRASQLLKAQQESEAKKSELQRAVEARREQAVTQRRAQQRAVTTAAATSGITPGAGLERMMGRAAGQVRAEFQEQMDAIERKRAQAEEAIALGDIQLSRQIARDIEADRSAMLEQTTDLLTGEETEDDLLDLAQETGVDFTALKLKRDQMQAADVAAEAQTQLATQKQAQSFVKGLNNDQLGSLTSEQANALNTEAGLPEGTVASWVLRSQEINKMKGEEQELENAKLQASINKTNAEANAKAAETAVDVVVDVRQGGVNAGDFIKSKEGFREGAYLDPAGIPTIGYGFTSVGGVPVKMGDTITREEADAEFNRQVQTYQNFKDLITVPLSSDQEAALTSFEYNLGRNIWKKDGKKIISLINQGKIEEAGELMKKFNKAKDPATGELRELRGLTNRRNEEAALLQVKALEQFDENLKPLYNKYHDGKMTTQDWKTVKELGLTPDQFAQESTNFKKAASSNGNAFAREVIELAEKLRKGVGRTGAAIGLDVLPFSDARTFQADFDAFKSKLALQNLQDLKAGGATFGALSDNELKFITDAATNLNIGAKDEDFEKELLRIINKLGKALPGGYSPKSLNGTGTGEGKTLEDLSNQFFSNEQNDFYNNL